MLTASYVKSAGIEIKEFALDTRQRTEAVRMKNKPKVKVNELKLELGSVATSRFYEFQELRKKTMSRIRKILPLETSYYSCPGDLVREEVN